jgi:hypothetical protein
MFVGERVRETVGLASTYLLDEAATKQLNTALGRHGIPDGAIRTYLPGADPASEPDGRRHRILTARTLAERPAAYVRRVLGGAARAHVSESLLPSDVARVVRLAERWESERLLAQAPEQRRAEPMPVPTPPERPQLEADRVQARPADVVPTVGDQAELFLAIRESVVTVLGDVAVDPASVLQLAHLARQATERKEMAAQALTTMEALRDELDSARLAEQDARREMEDVQIEHAIDFERLVAAEDKTRYLQNALTQAGRAEVAWSETPEREATTLPGSMSEVLDLFPKLRYVEFTGDTSVALDLDEFDTLGQSAGKAWVALLALDDYAGLKNEREFAGNFHDYCKATPSGCRGWSAERSTLTESPSTRNNPKFANARRFPVPTGVDPSGSTFMWSHIKVATLRTVSPRMHFYDDTTKTGKIYVGYLGRHLPNLHTN